MKLKAYWVPQNEIQDWLDKYQEKIKFIFQCNTATGNQQVIIVIDDA